MNPIPQFEPVFGPEEAKALHDYMSSGGWVTEFTQTQEFERKVAEFVECKHCVATNNGTISLVLALLALGVRPGAEVIVPDFTMIATPNAVRLAGGKPVMVDVDPHTLCLNVEKVQEAMSSITQGVIHVSLNGRAGDIKTLAAFCKKNGLFLLEDSAQSLGSMHQNQHLGTFGDIGSFSLSPAKIISTGQGGLLVTDNDDLATKMRRLKDFGRLKGGADIHDHLGYNFKFTDVQAVIGLEQLKKLPSRIARKKEIFALYRSLLQDHVQFIATDLDQTTPWFVDIFVNDPHEIQEHLKEKKIGSRLVYPPIHTQKVYEGVRGVFPVATEYCNKGLWLPSSISLTDEDVNSVYGVIEECLV